MTPNDSFEPTLTEMRRSRATAPAPSAERAQATVRALIIELAKIAAAEDDAAERRQGVAG